MPATGMFADILRTVARIPKGKVATYGQIAEAAGHPGAARQVVWALNSSHGAPWHRVLGAGGRIRLPGERGLEQKLRLRTEGIVISGDRIDLATYGHQFRRTTKPTTKR